MMCDLVDISRINILIENEIWLENFLSTYNKCGFFSHICIYFYACDFELASIQRRDFSQL